jgi:hypothetical protein
VTTRVPHQASNLSFTVRACHLAQRLNCKIRQILVSAVDGDIPTAIGGLLLSRRTSPSPVVHLPQGPMFGMVVQGNKSMRLENEVQHYGVGRLAQRCEPRLPMLVLKNGMRERMRTKPSAHGLTALTAGNAPLRHAGLSLTLSLHFWPKTQKSGRCSLVTTLMQQPTGSGNGPRREIRLVAPLSAPAFRRVAAHTQRVVSRQPSLEKSA